MEDLVYDRLIKESPCYCYKEWLLSLQCWQRSIYLLSSRERLLLFRIYRIFFIFADVLHLISYL